MRLNSLLMLITFSIIALAITTLTGCAPEARGNGMGYALKLPGVPYGYTCLGIYNGQDTLIGGSCVKD